MKCNEVFRSGPLFVRSGPLFEGHVFGGAYLGECRKEALDGFTVCFDHVNKEALWMMVQQKTKEIKKLKYPKNPYLDHPKGI